LTAPGHRCSTRTGCASRSRSSPSPSRTRSSPTSSPAWPATGLYERSRSKGLPLEQTRSKLANPVELTGFDRVNPRSGVRATRIYLCLCLSIYLTPGGAGRAWAGPKRRQRERGLGVGCGLHLYIYISVYPSISPLVETVERGLVPNCARERRDRRHVEVRGLGIGSGLHLYIYVSVYPSIPPLLETVERGLVPNGAREREGVRSAVRATRVYLYLCLSIYLTPGGDGRTLAGPKRRQRETRSTAR